MARQFTVQPKLIRTYEFEWNIDIVCPSYANILSPESITSATDLPDMSGTEYDSFIVGMIAQFKSAGYKMSLEEDYTHDSNRGSFSQYFTFSKRVDDIQIIVVVNVRVSDHADKPRGQKTVQQKRAEYVSKIGQEIADKEGVQTYYSYPIDITFDEKHLRSFFSAVMYVNSRLKSIQHDVEDAEAEQ